MRSPTIVDIAVHLGIGQATVSRALNNKPAVAPGTRAKVIEAARQLGYVPNVHARRLRGWVGTAIGLLWPYGSRLDNPFYEALIPKLCEAVWEHGNDLTIVPVQHHQDENIASVLGQRGAVGALTLGSQMKGTLDALQDSEIPTIQVGDYSDKCPGIGFVTLDHREAIHRIIEHLMGLGHRRFGFIGNPARSSPFRERDEAFTDALSSANAEGVSHRRWDDASEFASSLLEPCLPPTAIVASNDVYAHRTIQALRRHGLETPRDVSVTGFDDLAPSSGSTLTTIRVDLHRLADEAVGALLELMDGSGEIIQRRVPTKLVIRDTTGPPPDRNLRRS